MSNELSTAADTGTESERSTLLVTYVLHALAPFTALSAIVAVIISHIKCLNTSERY